MKSMWRQKFTECCEAIYRELGFPPPKTTHDDLLPLALELEYSGLMFELVHFPSDIPSKVLVAGTVGNLPDENIALGSKNLLKKNLSCSRAHAATFSINSENKTILCVYYESLENIDPAAWLRRMSEIGKNSVEMKNSCFDTRLSLHSQMNSSKTISLA